MAFQVNNQKTGHSFSVENTETVLDAAMRQSRAFSYSCRSGSCGSCKARLISGEVDPGYYAAGALSEFAAFWIALRPRARIDDTLRDLVQRLPAFRNNTVTGAVQITRGVANTPGAIASTAAGKARRGPVAYYTLGARQHAVVPQ